MKNKYNITIELKNLKNEIIKVIKLNDINDIEKEVKSEKNYCIKIESRRKNGRRKNTK